MRTAGLTMNNSWAHRALRQQGIETHEQTDVEADLTVLVESVTLKHRGPEEKYRPYLHVSGELLGIRPLEPLPYDIDELSYTLGKSDRVDAYYEFDDEQLVELTRKGYFSRPFEVPTEVAGIDWELPGKVDVLMLLPQKGTDDPPVVFAEVHDIANLEISKEQSGYDLVENFADFSTAATELEDLTSVRPEIAAREDELDALFTDEELGLDDLVVTSDRETAPSREEHEARRSDLDVESALEEVEAELDAAEAELHAEDEEETLEVLEEALETPEEPASLEDLLERLHDTPVLTLEEIDEDAVKEAAAKEKREQEQAVAVAKESLAPAAEHSPAVLTEAEDDDIEIDVWAASAPSAPSADPEDAEQGDLTLEVDDAPDALDGPETEADDLVIDEEPATESSEVAASEAEASEDEDTEQVTTEDGTDDERAARLAAARELHEKQTARAGRRPLRRTLPTAMSAEKRREMMRRRAEALESSEDSDERDLSA